MPDPTITDADREALDDIGAPYASWAEFCRRSDYDAALKAVADFRHAHTAPLEARIEQLREIVSDLCGAMEYWAGCDEGCPPDAAASEIMSAGGAWPACAYEKARKALEGRGS